MNLRKTYIRFPLFLLWLFFCKRTPCDNKITHFPEFYLFLFYATCFSSVLTFHLLRVYLYIVDFVTITFDLLVDCALKKHFDKIVLYLKPFQLSNLIYSKPIYVWFDRFQSGQIVLSHGKKRKTRNEWNNIFQQTKYTTIYFWICKQ